MLRRMLSQEDHMNSRQRMEERKLCRMNRRCLGKKHCHYCHYCKKTFAESKMFSDHLNYDFACWKLRKHAERQKSKRKTNKIDDERKDYDFEYDSDSGKGSSSDSSTCNDVEAVNPAIRMTLGRSQARQFEVLMTSETLGTKESVQNPVAKRLKTDISDTTSPMVTIKPELLKDLLSLNMKQEESVISMMTNTLETEEIKPIVFIPGKEKPSTGIRLLIDKNDMSVVMASEGIEEVFDNDFEDEENNQLETDVKPLEEKLGQNTVATIKMTVENDLSDENDHTESMASELVQSNIFDTEYTMCGNDECPKIGNHLCAFPSFRETQGFYKTKGVLNKKKSYQGGKSKFVPFNQTFLKTLGCTFYFKSYLNHTEVRNRSIHTTSGERFKITFYNNHVQSSSVGTLGSSKYKTSSVIATNMFEGNFIKYKIVIDKNPRSCQLHT
eukprot:GFUD01002688.1.p1 GENE.GFUD01002688.1~~GFUD01002688.1.p1  ORF type:complete len:441 (-),score=106.92 GFUD01002688.1:262-1584(-)